MSGFELNSYKQLYPTIKASFAIICICVLVFIFIFRSILSIYIYMQYIYLFIYLFIGLFIYLLIYLFIGWLTIPHPSISFIFHHQKMVISKHREWGSRCHIDDQNWLVPRGLDASQALSELHAIGQPSPRDETRKTLPW
jgi:hypothetical protein